MSIYKKPEISVSRHRGVILVVVLVVVAILSLSVLAYSRFMLSERRGAGQSVRQRQARLLAESGVEYVRFFLMYDAETVTEYGGIYDNIDEFCGHIVTDGSVAMTGSDAGLAVGSQFADDPMNIGRFSAVVPKLSVDGYLSGEDFRYGFEDESSKLNLRWLVQVDAANPGLGRKILSQLPGVTEEIADSILDWCDEDAEPREYGAEDEYYMALDPPYYTRNEIPESIDDLLLVKGMTPKLLYGIDWNRNGIIDEGEPDEATMDEIEVEAGVMSLGLISLLTLDSRESNRSPNGEAKININQEDIEDLRTQLESRLSNQTWVDYIISRREQGSSSGNSNGSDGSGGSSGSGNNNNGSSEIENLPDANYLQNNPVTYTPNNQSNSNTSSNSSTGTGSSTGTNSSTGSASTSSDDGTIKSLLDLVQTTSSGSALNSSNTSSAVVSSPFSSDPAEMSKYLPELYDNLTVSDTPPIGRININQAPRPVLEIFLNQNNVGESSTGDVTTQLTDVIEGIISSREPDPDNVPEDDMRYPFWLYTRGLVTDFNLMKQLEPYICT
ncbi:MAG: general secretion pathway protein GspK, partial [Planctomycetaceae bacterium]|nr:general secretion pathway protein GspK [Planctomycetaceae bacterium]